MYSSLGVESKTNLIGPERVLSKNGRKDGEEMEVEGESGQGEEQVA